jgi:ribonuclease T1
LWRPGGEARDAAAPTEAPRAAPTRGPSANPRRPEAPPARAAADRGPPPPIRPRLRPRALDLRDRRSRRAGGDRRGRAAIDRGGPFTYRKDGATFENREARLPKQPRGYWREYTVPTPG